MNSLYKIIFSLFLLLISASFAEAQTFNFYRSLDIEDTGQDVLELQKILNQDPNTLLAISGPGSINNETTYFGNLTKNALIKFQNIYRDEILTPVGLYYGTGYFGPSTIAFIDNYYSNNSKLNEETIEVSGVDITYSNQDNKEETVKINIDEELTVDMETENNQIDKNLDLVSSNSLHLYFVSENVFKPGDELIVVGENVGDNPEIYFSNSNEELVVSDVFVDYNFIYFDAPDLPAGDYDMYIKKGGYISNSLDVEIVVGYNPPKISTVSPSVISYGVTVTIGGSNFTSQNNLVMTPLGSYSGSSNGSEIVVEITRPANLNLGMEIADPIKEEFEGFIQVKNSNGLSDAEVVNILYN